MLYSLREKLREKKGFTLIEMILTVGIISVLTGIVSAGIYGYLVSAYMNRVNETAKTVFLAAQNYLTQEKQLGRLEEFHDNAVNFGEEITKEQLKEIFLANDPAFDFSAYEQKYGTTQVQYLLLEEGDGTSASNNPIYKIVKDYLNDKGLLEHTFLIEYDAGSGVVRSVFYTEMASSLSYSNDRNDKSNVILRDSSTLKKKRQGYYGVSSTSLVKHNLDLLSPAKIKLVNGERLYLEWKETNYLSQEDIANGFTQNATEAFDDTSLRDYLVYDVEVYKTTSGGDEKLFTQKNINASKSSGKTLAEADTNAAENGMVLSYKKSSNTYQLVLDDLHHSILKMYADTMGSSDLEIEKEIKASDMIYCKVSVRLAENPKFEGESEPVSTNLQSANFAGGAKTYSPTGLEIDKVDVYGNGNLKEDGTTREDGIALSAANARHINNMRNASNTSCFVQTADIDWAKPEADRSNQSGFFVPLKFAEYAGSAEEAGIYQGVFRVEKKNGIYYKLSNLKIDCLTAGAEKNVGMFRQNRGIIQGLHLVKPNVKGASQVGAVVGVNAGTVQDVTVDNGSVEGSYYVGGIAGRNLGEGTLIQLQCDANVAGNASKPVTDRIPLTPGETASYGQYIGGIAGYNQGLGDNLTTTIPGSDGKAARSEKTVSGIGCVGGIFGGNDTGAVVTGCANYSSLKVLAITGESNDIRDFGGIAGINEKDGRITSCTNKSVVFQEKANLNPKRIRNIGGIAGTNKGTLVQCQNKPDDRTVIDNNIKECMTAINSGKLPVYSGINVGGIAGVNDKTGEVNTCMAASVTTGYRMVGGLVGANRGTLTGNIVSENGVSQTSGGFVAASTDSAGGIAGASMDVPLKDCINRAVVFAGSAAGGIAGSNGGSGDYNFNTSSASAEYYDALLLSGYEATDQKASIVDCDNYGFVYAIDRYAGGIAGINFGQILNSNSTVEISAGSVLSGMTGTVNYKRTAKADCVGGIAGYNSGSVLGGSKQLNPVVAESYGKDCVGGVVGLNRGVIKEYARVLGNVYASGNFVGGFIGMNLNGESVENLAFSDGMQIFGEYFAGGIIGLNIAEGSESVHINGASTQASVRRGAVTAKAYAGGIIGYQTKQKGNLSELVRNELAVLIANAYAPYQPSKGTGTADGMTVFSNCINRSEVYAQRYAGGIVGYNSNDSGLLVTKATNYGKVEIQKTQGKVTDGFYFVGGITGRNSAGGILDQCVNDGSVISPSIYLGGICEVNEGSVQFCVSGKSKNYNEDGIRGENSVGGLVGLNSKNIVRCSTNLYAKVSGGDNTGGIAGTNDENGIITGDIAYAWVKEGINDEIANNSDGICISSGSVAGADNTGGIVGRNEGRVENVSVKDATISGDSYVGGFIGNNTGLLATTENPNDSNEISGLINNAKKVTGIHQVGGIVGRHNAAIIKNCINQGIVEATGANGCAGGITGSVDKKIKILECTNYGTVISNNFQAGGIVGNNKGSVEKCRNYGSVSGSITVNNESAIGGIAGVNEKDGTVKDCISGDNQKDLDKVQNPNAGTKNALKGVYIVGGLAGINKGTLSNENSGRDVSIDIVLTGRKLSGAGNIGGVMGITKSDNKIIQGYTYSGMIQVPLNASQNQFIGGIIGQVPTGVTLENCIFSGKITGLGNADEGSSSSYGIGGLAGYSDGTIYVYQNADGIYTSNTENSSVAGCVNTGGITGLIGKSHQILFKNEDGNAVKVSLLSENMDADKNNDSYYVNLAAVAGVKQTGGFYGRVVSRQGAVLTYYQNGLEGNQKAGNIQPNTASSQSASNIGGITGLAHNSGSSTLEFVNVRNYGIIGDKENYITAASAVGGIVGYCQNGGQIFLTRAVNYGLVSCGNDILGGIAGRTSATTITDSYNHGEIISKARRTGGMVGYLDNSTITISGGHADPAFNKGKITVNANVAEIAGIAGLVAGNSSIKGVENAGEINCSRTSAGDAYIGGIAGRLANNSVLNQCVNSGALILDKVNSAGGIVGYINGPAIEVKNCTNKGTVKNVLSDGGGIAGKMEGTAKLTFQNNTNSESGIVYGKYRIGGIIGFTNTGNGANWEIADCTNEAKVHGILSNGSQNNVISHIGGTIGNCSNSAEIKRFVNKGDIVISRAENSQKIGSVASVGGVFGNIVNNGTNIKAVECVNYGTFEFNFNGENTKLQQIGGIAGTAQNIVILDTCKNYAEMDFTALSNSAQESIGGIMGDGGINTKLVYCVNTGSVLGNTSVAVNVGGVAGTTRGLVYSCGTKLSEDGTGTIQGKSRVGGIVGYARDATCKISSIANKDGTNYEFGINNVAVTGRESVGGIAGLQEGATIYSMTNSLTSKITLLSRNTSKNSSQSAGGISGTAVFNGTVPGVIANCYNFGEVRFEDASNSYYLGGVIGNRAWKGNGSARAAAVSLKDSFYLYDSGTHNLIDGSQPDANIAEAVLAVGNEPEGSYGKDIEDQQFGNQEEPELMTADRFRWSKSAYEKMYRAIKGLEDTEPVPDSDKWDQMETVLANIVKDYNKYKLPVPKTGTVVSNDNYSYTLPIEKMPGFCSYLEINLYTEDTKDADIKAETAASLLRVTKDVNMDFQLTNVGFDASKMSNYLTHVGQVIKVAVKAHGVGQTLNPDGEIIYTADSDNKVVQKFILMPVLEKPQMEVVGQEGSVLTFCITNWAEYQKSAGAFYESIRNQLGLNGLYIYQSLKNGLENFTITDYYLATQNAGRDNNFKDSWTINQSEIDADGIFTIDYSTSAMFRAQKSNRQYHDWDMQAVALHRDWSVEADSVIANNHYRYTSSYLANLKFRIEAITKMKPPTELQSVYTGGIDWENDLATPGYEIRFKKSGSPEEAVSHYLITVTNPANGRTHTIQYVSPEVGDDPDIDYDLCSYAIDKDTLSGTADNQLGVDLSAGSQPLELIYTISTQPNDGDAAKFFAASDNAEGKVIVIKKQYSIEEDIWVTVENGNKPNELTFHWNDDHATGSDVYLVSYQVKQGDTVISQAAEAAQSGMDCKIVLPDDGAYYVIEFTVVRQGVITGASDTAKVESLNSDRVTHIQNIGKQLEAVSNVSVAFKKSEGVSLFYDLTFDIPAGDTAESCKGFLLEVLSLDVSPAQLIPEVEVLFGQPQPIEVEIPVTQAGKQFYVYVTAQSAGIDYRDSDRAQSNSMTIPTNKLNAPTALTAVTLTPEGQTLNLADAGNAMTKSALELAVYTFGWNIGSSGNVKCQQIILRDEADNSLFTRITEGNITTFDLREISAELSRHTGKKMKLEVYNMPLEPNLMLPSEASVLEFYVPDIRLEAVTDVTVEPVRTDGTMMYYNLRFTVPAVLTADECQSFVIQAVEEGSNAELLPAAIDIPFDTVQPYEIGVPVERAGKQFKLQIVSNPVAGGLIASVPADSLVQSMPAVKLAAPGALNAVIKDYEGMNLTNLGNTMLQNDLTNAVYILSFSIPNPSNVSNQQLEIWDVDSNALLFSQQSDPLAVLTQIETAQNWVSSAGRTLELRIYNLPVNINTSLPSEAAAYQFYLPTVTSSRAPLYLREEPRENQLLISGMFREYHLLWI